MSKTPPGDELTADEYELSPSQPDAEPLLPTHQSQSRSQSHPYSKSKSRPFPKHDRRAFSAFRRALTYLCLAVILTVPSLALAACYFGDRVRGWESLPGEVKNWLGKVVPGTSNRGAFPTESALLSLCFIWMGPG